MIWGSRLNSLTWSSNAHAGMVVFRFLNSVRETVRHPDALRTPIRRYAQDAHCILRLRAGMHVRIASCPALPKTGKPRCMEHCAICFTEEVCFTDGIPLPQRGHCTSRRIPVPLRRPPTPPRIESACVHKGNHLGNSRRKYGGRLASSEFQSRAAHRLIRQCGLIRTVSLYLFLRRRMVNAIPASSATSEAPSTPSTAVPVAARFFV
jgi:hypothetical protein